MSRTLIVSNRLPTKATRTPDGLTFSPSEGGLATGLGAVYRTGENLWIGWPGVSLEHDEEAAHITEYLLRDRMAPVFLTPDEIQDYYEGFSNEILWPIFHYFGQHAVFEPRYWDAYVAVNEKFAAAVLAVAGPEDTIWVHDYQLLLLPALLRKALPKATIGFFLHIPFPSVELFQLLPWRRELLAGMLGADLVGFHTFGYARHFLASTAALLGLPTEHHRVAVDGRLVWADALPMGIDFGYYARTAMAPETQVHVATYRAALRDVQVVLTIDRLDYTKGIAQRLHAFDRLLSTHPEWRGQVSLVMVVVPSRDQVARYRDLKTEIDELVGRINARYRTIDWNPIHYFYRGLPPEELSALYALADVALVTPLRDGMNLVAKEYVASCTDGHGVLVLSEQAGAARELADALLINPVDVPAMAAALDQALRMPPEEQRQRLHRMRTLVRRYNVRHWTELFLNRLFYCKMKQDALAADDLGPDEMTRMRTEWDEAPTRLLLLDYDGTLMPFDPDPQNVRPDPALLALLTTLAAQPRTRVVVISGRDRATLQQWLGHLPINFVAEHGVWMRDEAGTWRLPQPLRNDWKRELYPVLELFVRRTPGAFIEEKEYSLVWHWRRADAALGADRARELAAHLSFLVTNTDLQVLEGNRVIELKNAGADKGTAAARLLEEHPADFILAIGDDRTDEDTFRALPWTAWMVKVGEASTSKARFSVDSPAAVRAVLRGLVAAELG